MKKERLTHLPLEPYQARYTANLREWEVTAFSNRFDVQGLIPTDANTESIISGEVLDAVGRPAWALSQMRSLLSQGPYIGKVYFSDFYTPGLDALAYSRLDFKAAAFCWAQTFDQYDFTRRLFTNWMRPWEIMALEIYSRVYVACSGLKELIVAALPHIADKILVTGLPYNHRVVFSSLRTSPSGRQFDVVYAARWDQEKNPGRFLDLIDEGNFKGVVCTGHPQLQGTDQVAIERAKKMEAAGNLRILTNLDRPSYFLVLASSNVLFNCGDQDWISYTLLDGLTFGCKPLYPAHRSFPEALYYRDAFLYPPGDIDAAAKKASKLITEQTPEFSMLAARVLEDNDSALAMITEDLYGL